MHAVGVIPARFQSSRFPGKPLTLIAGKTLIERVYERAREAHRLDRLLVATDDQRILNAVEALSRRFRVGVGQPWASQASTTSRSQRILLPGNGRSHQR